MAEAWIILAACAVRFAIFTGTLRAVWNSTLSLILAEIRTSLSNLQDEGLLRRTLIEGDFRVDGGDIVRVRTTMILGAIAALQLDQTDQRKASRADVIDLVYKYRNKLFYWGDSAFPYAHRTTKCITGRRVGWRTAGRCARVRQLASKAENR